MNYLAHALLSPPDAELILLGNMACDMIRPSDQNLLPEQIKIGMERHQAIDRMTDSHEGFKQMRDALGGAGHPYAGVLTDIIFDHYLAMNWERYSQESMELFKKRVYGVLKREARSIPGPFHRLAGALRRNDWFGSYGSRKGLHSALSRLNYRSSRYIDADSIMETESRITESALEGFHSLMQELCAAFG